MSALAGLWHFDGKPGAAEGCARMLAAQQFYGPHDGRQWSDGSLALGRRLFRTLPEDLFDRQPLHSIDSRLTLVADVRLDNRAELAAALGLSLGAAASLCDADILLACVEQWGEAAIERLVGDFAFAWWDGRAGRLLLVRDFAGQRPLHYHCGKAFFAFASMPKGLHAHPDIPCGPDEQAVAEFVALIPQAAGGTFYKDIARVEPGHFVSVTREGVSSHRYWQPRERAAASGGDHAEGLRHHLDEATRCRLRGGGQAVGTHLSAGIDSAAVTATAARLWDATGGKVIAFTAVPREDYAGPCPADRIGDEGPLAAATAALYSNIEHVRIRAGSVSPLADLDRYYHLFDRPTLNLANWTWLSAINAAARERGLAVVLTGQMGNASLSYAGFERLPELLGQGRPIEWARELAALKRRGTMGLQGALAQTFGMWVPPWLWRRITGSAGFSDVLQYTAIRSDRMRSLERTGRERGVDFGYRPRKSGLEARLWMIRRMDLANYNKGSLAGWGIDHRDPTADKRLVEFCLYTPLEQFLARGESRLLARRALSDRLPGAVLDERRKGYQAVDWHEGFTAARGEITAQLERLSQFDPAEQLLDLERLRHLADNMPAEGWERAPVIQSYRLAMLRGIAAGHFLRKASGSNL
jgi:asparagine synthase (glutamine-hydrolysing)